MLPVSAGLSHLRFAPTIRLVVKENSCILPEMVWFYGTATTMKVNDVLTEIQLKDGLLAQSFSAKRRQIL